MAKDDFEHIFFSNRIFVKSEHAFIIFIIPVIDVLIISIFCSFVILNLAYASSDK